MEGSWNTPKMVVWASIYILEIKFESGQIVIVQGGVKGMVPHHSQTAILKGLDFKEVLI